MKEEKISRHEYLKDKVKNMVSCRLDISNIIINGLWREYEGLQQERDELKVKLEDMTLCRDIASGHARQAEKERDLARKQLSKSEAIIKAYEKDIVKDTELDKSENKELNKGFRQALTISSILDENKSLKAIIKEAREYAKEELDIRDCYGDRTHQEKDLLAILDKEVISNE